MSGIKRIVVHVDGGAHDASVLRLSAALATRFGAGLEAVFASVPAFVPASADGITVPEMIELQRAFYSKRADTAKSTLAGISLQQGKPIWTRMDALASDAVIARGRYADLTVLAQPSPEETGVAIDYDAPAEIVMSLGRPVLMVPYAGIFADAGKRILVAWSGTRESARALGDALPFLVSANEVTILSVNPAADAAVMEVDLKQWLLAHGISSRTQTAHTNEIEVSDVLLSAAADFSADLLVMGAYGRPRLRELILGGATHDIFRHMTMPVLMSH